MQQYFRIGQITSPHGIRGTERVFPCTEDPSRFEELETVYLSEPDKDEPVLTMHIQHVAYQQNMVLLTLQEITDRTQAEKYRGYQLWVDRDHALALEEGEYYLADLIGCTVITEDNEVLGQVSDSIETGANLVLEVAGGSKEYLIPFIKDCVRMIDLNERTIRIHVIPGLLDL